MKHTPGPWKAVTWNLQYPNKELRLYAPDGLIATFGLETTLDQEANAQLIASAPELLEACKLLRDTVDDFLPNIGKCVLQDYQRLNEGLIKGRVAIAKAEGKEKP